MKIIDKKGAKNSSTKSELTVEEVIAILVIAAFAFVLALLLGTVGHWLYEYYLSNQVQFIPFNQVELVPAN